MSGRSFVQILEMVQNVGQIIKEHPSTSIKRLRQQVKLSYGTCQKILNPLANNRNIRLESLS
jgi:predicted transcriptional regulator